MIMAGSPFGMLVETQVKYHSPRADAFKGFDGFDTNIPNRHDRSQTVPGAMREKEGRCERESSFFTALAR
jgi:hypothetical protein